MLLGRVPSFRRIHLAPNESLCIKGSDDGLLVYVSNICRHDLMERLYQSIIALPTPDHYHYRGIKRSEYRTWHFCVWAKYSKVPFLSKELKDNFESGMKFLQDNAKVFRSLSGLLGQVAPSVFETFQLYPLPDDLERLCGAWLGCAINHGGNSPNQTNVHRDASEALYGYSGLISCGNYTGGALVLYELETILELKSGDMVIFPDALINHSNEQVQGDRCSLVAFTQENVYNYWARRYNLTLRRKMRYHV